MRRITCIACLAAALSFPTVGVASSFASTTISPPRLQSTSDGEVASISDQHWYEKGPWPLIGAVSVLAITQAVTVGVVFLQAERALKTALRQRKIEYLSSSLNEFYNPLLALLDINRDIFEKTGPSSFPNDEIERNAAAEVWKETKKKIIQNNNEIENIIRSKSHLISSSDKFETYRELLVHVAMYETFQKIQTDIYSKFLFPKEIRWHISKTRDIVLFEFKTMSGEI